MKIAPCSFAISPMVGKQGLEDSSEVLKNQLVLSVSLVAKADVAKHEIKSRIVAKNLGNFKKITPFGFIFTCFQAVYPHQIFSKKVVFIMVVCVPFAPLFASPELMSEQVDELLYGEEVEIIDELGGFYRIKTDYGYTGWTIKPNLFEKLHDANHIVTSSFADLLFEGRNYFHPPITLPRGARVDVGFSHKEDKYGFAVLPSKRIYYIKKDHIAPLSSAKKESEELFRESVVETAKEYLGVQYRWGGRTHMGIDCSGLCFNAYRFNGVDIWRDADIDKSENLRKIEISEAKKGDLVFFEGHMAIWLGNGEIIHSSASKGKTGN